MTFDALANGSAVFVDANPLVYAFTADPRFGQACEQLLLRIENHELTGFSSAHVLSALSHRLMTIEAATLLGRPLTGMANWLKRHPAEIQKLARSRQAIDEVALIGINVLPVTSSLVSVAADISRQYGLLSDDALVVAVMRHHGLTNLASLDTDFDRVPGIARYSAV